MSEVIKARLSCASLVVLAVGASVWNWYNLLQTGSYYLKLAIFGPCAALIFLLFLLFPNLLSQPREKKSEIIVGVVAGIGILLGVLNWYSMANGI